MTSVSLHAERKGNSLDTHEEEAGKAVSMYQFFNKILMSQVRKTVQF
jgi:hypothetical protein